MGGSYGYFFSSCLSIFQKNWSLDFFVRHRGILLKGGDGKYEIQRVLYLTARRPFDFYGEKGNGAIRMFIASCLFIFANRSLDFFFYWPYFSVKTTSCRFSFDFWYPVFLLLLNFTISRQNRNYSGKAIYLKIILYTAITISNIYFIEEISFKQMQKYGPNL